MRRVKVRRKTSCPGDRLALRLTSGLLTHPAMSGETNHSSRIGAARSTSSGVDRARAMASATAISGPIHIARHEAIIALPAGLFPASLDGFHSSIPRCVTHIRQIVRAMAPRLNQASYGRQASSKQQLRAAPYSRLTDAGQMLAPQDLGGFAQRLEKPGAQTRDEQHADHRQRPPAGRREHRPAENQEQGQGRRDEAAPQIVEELPL